MKCVMKAIGLLAVGPAIAAIGYPVMHELGHSAVAVLVGAKVIEIRILPLPAILCEVEGADRIGIMVIGYGGLILPFLLSAIIRPRRFWGWYTSFVVKGISFLGFVISVISGICFMLGHPLPNDDITQILTLWPEARWLCLTLSGVLAAAALTMLFWDRPLKRCAHYFENEGQAAGAI